MLPGFDDNLLDISESGKLFMQILSEQFLVLLSKQLLTFESMLVTNSFEHLEAGGYLSSAGCRLGLSLRL